jgi:hypothetical protein
MRVDRLAWGRPLAVAVKEVGPAAMAWSVRCELDLFVVGILNELLPFACRKAKLKLM